MRNRDRKMIHEFIMVYTASFVKHIYVQNTDASVFMQKKYLYSKQKHEK